MAPPPSRLKVAVYHIGVTSSSWGTGKRSDKHGSTFEDVTKIRAAQPHIIIWLEVGPRQWPADRVSHACS